MPLQLMAQRSSIKSLMLVLDESHKLTTEGSLLLGDAIMNFRTVQSFGHEDLIVHKYDEFMAPAHATMAKADLH